MIMLVLLASDCGKMSENALSRDRGSSSIWMRKSGSDGDAAAAAAAGAGTAAKLGLDLHDTNSCA